MKKYTIIGLYIMALMTLSANTISGTLDDFESAQNEAREKEKTKFKSTSSRKDPYYSQQRDEEDDFSFSGFFFELVIKSIGYAALYGGGMSYERYYPSQSDIGVIKRKTGELLIPQYRFDLHYQRANANIKSTDLRFEAGMGPFAAQFRTTAMIEGKEEDTLRLNQAHALYRMSFGNHVGVNFGLGIAQLRGNSRNTNFSMSFPIYFHPTKTIGFEAKISTHFLSNATILDQDYSILFTRKLFSATLGHRKLSKAGVDISGPYIGISAHY